jgi:hypothetical protein
MANRNGLNLILWFFNLLEAVLFCFEDNLFSFLRIEIGGQCKPIHSMAETMVFIPCTFSHKHQLLELALCHFLYILLLSPVDFDPKG